jgi:upstream stimulatory factor
LQSKGGILAKACEYIGELKSTNCRLAATLREHANTAEELDALRREVSELRKENMMIKQQLGPTEDDSTVIITTSE